jgi:hypothetical protein
MWHLPQGCPVWRAKAGRAAAGRVKPMISMAVRTTAAPIAASARFCPTLKPRQPRLCIIVAP